MEEKNEIDLQALSKLLEPFPESWLSKLPKPTKKDNQKGSCKDCGGWHGLPAIHIDYVGHADLTRKLLEVDPLWNWEPFAIDEHGLPAVDKSSGEWNLWIRLTVAGMTRVGVGNVNANEHDAMKQLIGDALRNAAMRFGAALDLWSKSERVESQLEEKTTLQTVDDQARERGWNDYAECKRKADTLAATIKELAPELQEKMREKRELICASWPPTFDEYNKLVTELNGLTSETAAAPFSEGTAEDIVAEHFPGATQVEPPPRASTEKVERIKNYIDTFQKNDQKVATRAWNKYAKQRNFPRFEDFTEEQADESINFIESLS